MDVFLHPAFIGGAIYLAPLAAPAIIPPQPVSAGTVQYIKLPTSQFKLIRITVT